MSAQRASAAATKGGAHLQLHGLYKRYGAREVLHNTLLDISPGQFVAVVGRSGCGKSTLLRLSAGLEAASAGSVCIDGMAINAPHADVRVMVQEPRLLPWRSVLDNIRLGVADDARQYAAQVLAQVGLAERAEDWPACLSGGQRQRVALARALLHRPRLLLLDEPLGALDALTRIEMQRLIEALWRQTGFTALLVTHDVQEAVMLADRVILIEDGCITLDEVVALPRPRVPGDPACALIERRILQRLLQRPTLADQQPAGG